MHLEMFVKVAVNQFVQNESGELRVVVFVGDKNDVAPFVNRHVESVSDGFGRFFLGRRACRGQQTLGSNGFGRLHRQVPARQDFRFRTENVFRGLTQTGRTARIVDRIDRASFHNVAHEQLGLRFVNRGIKKVNRRRCHQAGHGTNQDLPFVLEHSKQNIVPIQAGMLNIRTRFPHPRQGVIGPSAERF